MMGVVVVMVRVMMMVDRMVMVNLLLLMMLMMGHGVWLHHMAVRAGVSLSHHLAVGPRDNLVIWSC